MTARFLAGLALAALCSSAGAQPAAAPPPKAGAPVVDRVTQQEELRFRTERYERMTVPVLLSGTGPYRFLVDTGADHTAISRQLALRLGLVESGRASLHSVSGVSTVTTTTVPELKLTRKPVRIGRAPLLDSGDMGADGILGVDSLKSQRVQFDFERQSMAVVPSAVPDQMDEPGSIIIRATRRSGRLVVADARADGRKLTVVVDTGSQISIGNSALRRRLADGQLIDAMRRVELLSVTGETISGDYMFVRSLEMGGVELRHLAVVFADAHTFRKLGFDDRPALLLGMNAMRAFKRVSIDFANRRFKVVVPERSALDLKLARAE